MPARRRRFLGIVGKEVLKLWLTKSCDCEIRLGQQMWCADHTRPDMSPVTLRSKGRGSIIVSEIEYVEDMLVV
jgi:hypothetical protein